MLHGQSHTQNIQNNPAEKPHIIYLEAATFEEKYYHGKLNCKPVKEFLHRILERRKSLVRILEIAKIKHKDHTEEDLGYILTYILYLTYF